MKICVSHHHGCDCREAEFEKFQARVRELESEVTDLTTVRNNYRYEHVALKEENARLRAVVEAARNQIKLQDKNTVPSLIAALRDLDGEKKREPHCADLKCNCWSKPR